MTNNTYLPNARMTYLCKQEVRSPRGGRQTVFTLKNYPELHDNIIKTIGFHMTNNTYLPNDRISFLSKQEVHSPWGGLQAVFT